MMALESILAKQTTKQMNETKTVE